MGNSSISTFRCTVDLTVTSDERMKTDIIDCTLGLDFINLLRPVKYKRINPQDYPVELLEDRFSRSISPDSRPGDDNTIYDGPHPPPSLTQGDKVENS